MPGTIGRVAFAVVISCINLLMGTIDRHSGAYARLGPDDGIRLAVAHHDDSMRDRACAGVGGWVCYKGCVIVSNRPPSLTAYHGGCLSIP